MVRRASNMLKNRKLESDLSARNCGMELAPCCCMQQQVVKASKGHYPQPFLISMIKNWDKCKSYFQINKENVCFMIG